MEEMERRQKEAKNQALQESIRRAQEALQSKWEIEGIEEHKVFVVDIPKQTVVIGSREKAEYSIRTLKSIGVRGTYRITTRGRTNAGN